MNKLRTLGLAAVAMVGCAHAAPITVSSYDTVNGDSGPSGGYWDDTYNGTGTVTQDGAPLTGGTGDLTNGIIDQDGWVVSELQSSASSYVGWLASSVDVTFNFDPGTVLDSVTVHFADSNGFAGVDYIDQVTVGGQVFTFTDPGNVLTSSLTVPLGGIVTQALTMTFESAGAWIFISEVEFDGTQGMSAVPVPGAALLLGSAVPFFLRRKSAKR
ncbi:MAG: hypothetical protein AAGH41_01975 [Pseudomonadota bacterium]